MRSRCRGGRDLWAGEVGVTVIGRLLPLLLLIAGSLLEASWAVVWLVPSGGARRGLPPGLHRHGRRALGIGVDLANRTFRGTATLGDRSPSTQRARVAPGF